MIETVKKTFRNQILKIQKDFEQSLLLIDPSIKKTETLWDRKDQKSNDGGGGITWSFEGEVIENGGVNTSLIYGAIKPEFAKQLGLEKPEIWATGVSIILHPKSPHCPSFHANFRMLNSGDVYWFGGGSDLTPFYPHLDDFKYFHSTLKNACAPYKVYPKFKKTCDEYFVNKHRNNEMRGIGGIFFDHWKTEDIQLDLKMVTDLSESLIPSYFPILEKRKNLDFTSQDKDFQEHRRGRYVEFNLIHDRGTHFGLKSGGNIDSILISLPKRCQFTYQYAPTENRHMEMLKYYKTPQDWTL